MGNKQTSSRGPVIMGGVIMEMLNEVLAIQQFNDFGNEEEKEGNDMEERVQEAPPTFWVYLVVEVPISEIRIEKKCAVSFGTLEHAGVYARAIEKSEDDPEFGMYFDKPTEPPSSQLILELIQVLQKAEWPDANWLPFQQAGFKINADVREQAD